MACLVPITSLPSTRIGSLTGYSGPRDYPVSNQDPNLRYKYQCILVEDCASETSLWMVLETNMDVVQLTHPLWEHTLMQLLTYISLMINIDNCHCGDVLRNSPCLL